MRPAAAGLLVLSLLAPLIFGCAKHGDAVSSAGKHSAKKLRTYALRLEFPKGKEVVYSVHRVWKSFPQNSGNGDQVHDFYAVVQALPSEGSSGKGNLSVRVAKFQGVDQTGTSTKHLSQIAPEIEKLRFVLDTGDSGTSDPWPVSGANPAGWAGYMVMKAIGRYEVGFLDLVYSKQPVAVGTGWFSTVLVGDEGFEGDRILNLKGQNAQCRFVLESVDLTKQSAKITFAYSTTITATLVDILDANRTRSVKETDSATGHWVVDLVSGLPKAFHSERKKSEEGAGSTQSEQVVTDFSRASGPFSSQGLGQ